MENNIDNKIRFMGLYLGTVTVRHQAWETRKTEKLTSIRLQDEYYLELKPLSSITDEDAIEVAKILGYDYSDEGDYFTTASNYLERYYYNPKDTSIGVVDYLRSRGYAYYYMGLDVDEQIEYGWIKLVE